MNISSEISTEIEDWHSDMKDTKFRNCEALYHDHQKEWNSIEFLYGLSKNYLNLLPLSFDTGCLKKFGAF